MATKPTRQSVAKRREKVQKQLEDLARKEKELSLLQAELDADACLKIIKENDITVEEMLEYVRTKKKENRELLSKDSPKNVKEEMISDEIK